MRTTTRFNRALSTGRRVFLFFVLLIAVFVAGYTFLPGSATGPRAYHATALAANSPQNVIIPDPILRDLIRDSLGIPKDRPITLPDLSLLTALEAPDRGIRNLTGLEFAVNLEIVQFRNNQISNLMPLSQLQKLVEVDLTENPLDTDSLIALSNKPALSKLTLNHAAIKSMDFLRGLPKLKQVYLNFNEIQVIPNLDLPALINLEVYGNKINDIAGIASLPDLTLLKLDKNNIQDISALATLTNLETLFLFRNEIRNLSALANLSKLETLLIYENAIQDISPLATLSIMKTLDLSRNDIRDINPLADLNKLETLRLDVNQIADLSALQGKGMLQILSLRDNRIADAALTGLYGLNNLVELDLRANPIQDNVTVDQLADNLAKMECSDIQWDGTCPPPELRAMIKHVHRDRVLVTDLVQLDVMGTSDSRDPYVQLRVDWGDGSPSTYEPRRHESNIVIFDHVYADTSGEFVVRARARNSDEIEGRWSAPRRIKVFRRRAAAPYFEPKPGLSRTLIDVRIYAEPGSQVYYTLDGSKPDTNSIPYRAPLKLDAPTQVRARAYHANFLESEISDGLFEFRAAKPNVDPPPDEYKSPRRVRMKTTTPGANIFYTLDGSEPDSNSALYSDNPIIIDTTATLRTRAYRSNWQPSELHEGTFKILPKPSIDANLFPQAFLGHAYTVAARINDNGNTSTKSVFYRIGGSLTHHRVAMVQNDGIFFATIPADSVTLRGLQLFISAYVDENLEVTWPASDSLGYVYHSVPVRFEQVQRPEPIDADRWRLISFPVNLNNPHPMAIMGLYSRTRHLRRMVGGNTLLHYKYQRSDSSLFALLPGRGFFFRNADSTSLEVVSGTGVVADTGHAIELLPGWNSIGNPFAFPVSWYDVEKSEWVAWLQAYDPDRQDWSGDAIVLEPWEGYYVENLAPIPQTIIIPPKETKLRQVDFQPNLIDWQDLRKGEWMLQLAVNDGVVEAWQSYLGVRLDAKIERDAYDIPEPPPFSGLFGLTFRRLNWQQHAGFYAADVRPPNPIGDLWDFEVSHPDSARRVKLYIRHMRGLPRGWQMLLTDSETGNRIDLAKAPYEFTIEAAGKPRHFELSIGRPGYAKPVGEAPNRLPDAFALEQNFPNPFNAATRFEYHLPEDAHVDLVIYDLNGAQVKRLVQGEQPAGIHAAIWDGRSDAGLEVASGVYFITFRAGQHLFRRKVILIK